MLGFAGGALIGYHSGAMIISGIGDALTGEVVGYAVGLIVAAPLPRPSPFVGPGVAVTTALSGLVAQGRC